MKAIRHTSLIQFIDSYFLDTQIFSSSFELKTMSLACHLTDVFRRSNLTYSVFRPFLDFQELFKFPFLDGDSPVDFLKDPRRAGDLYCDPRYIAEELVLLWIAHVKDVLVWSDCSLYS